MKKLPVTFVTASILAMAASAWCQDAPPGPEKPLTMDQALETAFTNNPDIKSALDQLDKSKAGVAEARANYYPKANLDATQLFHSPKETFPNPSGEGTVVIQPSSSAMAKAAMQVPVDLNKRLSYVSDIASDQYHIDVYGLVTASEQLIFRVKTAYYNLLRARGQEEVAQASVDVAAARLKDTNAKFSAGTAPKFDVTRAQVEVANLNQQLIATKTSVATARTLLNQVLGIDPNAQTMVVKSEIPVQDIKVDIPKRVDEAYRRRPEVRTAQLDIDLAKRNVRLQRTGIVPSMALLAAYNYDFQTSLLSLTKLSWDITLDLTIPIWDGGVTTAKVAGASADVRKSMDSLDKLKLTVASEVRIAALNLQEAIERVSTTAEGVTLAEEALRLANVRYNSGISTLVEVTDAESALTQSRFYLVQAQFDYVLAVAELQRATATQPEMEKLVPIRDYAAVM